MVFLQAGKDHAEICAFERPFWLGNGGCGGGPNTCWVGGWMGGWTDGQTLFPGPPEAPYSLAFRFVQLAKWRQRRA